MEKDIAVLMADLSGYTALTETHGASSAADLIDKYVEIVENCLVGDCRLQDCTGDQVMIFSPSADYLLATAVMILQSTSAQHNFLQVHGGLHFGGVLNRNGSYFGSAINLTSRIATKANPGKFWCSSDFVSALKDSSAIKLKSLGKHSFKNVNEEKEIVELVSEPGHPFAIDPVCRMLIVELDRAVPHPEMENVLFCSEKCLAIFKNNQRADELKKEYN